MILVAAHLSKWEIAPAAGVSTGIPLKFVYSPMQNPRLDRMLRRKRESLGLDLISKKQGIRAFVRQLQGGGSIGLLADQRSDRGELVPFFGAEMLTTVVPARLALRYDCDLVPVRVERLGGAHFRVAFHEPIRPDDEGADEPQKTLQMTRQVNELFEAWIREQPAEWFCSKRKWPKTATAATQS